MAVDHSPSTQKVQVVLTQPFLADLDARGRGARYSTGVQNPGQPIFDDMRGLKWHYATPGAPEGTHRLVGSMGGLTPLGEGGMDAFALRNRLTGDYGDYVRSFIQIRGERIRTTRG
jgi:hypothetical protein